MADWGYDDAVGGGAEGGVGNLVLVAVDALWHLLVLVVGGNEQLLVIGVGGWWKQTASGDWCRWLVEFGELWWLVLVIGVGE